MEGVAIVGVAVVDFVGVLDVVDLWGCVVGGPGQAAGVGDRGGAAAVG